MLALRADIDKALQSLDKRRKSEALEAAKKAAGDLGFKLEDLLKTGAAKASLPKYANPENPEQTWTGRGRKPKWVTAALDSGKAIEDLAI